jgi:hypothetical protein
MGVPRGVDFGAIGRARAGRDRAVAQRDARHDKEYEFATGLVEKEYKVKVLRADPKFNSVTDAEWNTLAEGERLRNEQKKSEAALGQGASEGLAEQGLAATGTGGTFDEKRAFAERANVVGNLNQLSGRMDTLERERGQAVAGQGFDQLSERAVAVDTEERALATKLGDEERKRQTPEAQVKELEAQHFLNMAKGLPVDPNVQKMVNERARLDPVRQWLAATLSGGGGGGVTVSPSEAESRRKKFRTEFKASTNTKGWKIVNPDPNDKWEMDQHRAGYVIIKNKKTGEVASYDGG